MLQQLIELWPAPRSAAIGGVWGLFLFVIAGGWSARLRRLGWRVGDTRKVFHFAICTGAAILRCQADIGAVSAYGSVVTVGVIWATWRGQSSGLFLALGRPSDAPHEKWHVITPMVCTAVGGVLAHLIAGPLSAIPYLVTAWGDAVGEPIGIRWGRHPYRVPTFGRVISMRSWEGSAAVCAASVLAAGLGLMANGKTDVEILVWAVPIGLGAAVIEAISPHGWDNLTLLVGVACLTRLSLG